MLWVDKYRPRTLDKVMVHKEEATKLKNLVKMENKPWKVEAGTRKIEDSRTVMWYKRSLKKWLEIGLFDVAGNRGFEVLVLNEVDKRSKEAQHSLRRTMEKYSAACRLILCCSSASAVRSRCLNIRINSLSRDEIAVLMFVARKENLVLPPELGGRIAYHSNRNLRRSILCLEAYKVKQYPFTADQEVQTTYWEQFIVGVANDIVAEQSPKKLFQVRDKLYELLVNCIPPEVILKRSLDELKLDSELKHEVCNWAAFYEHRMQQGQKAIFSFGSFCC